MVSDYQPKPNGNTPAEPVLLPRIVSGMMKACWKNMLGTRTRQPIQWVNSLPISGDYTTCMVMCGSGARIGMTIIRQIPSLIQRDLPALRTGSFAAAPGSASPGVAARPTAFTTRRTTGATTAGSGSRQTYKRRTLC